MIKNKKITAVVLAAGKSTRMKQDFPKVITDLGGRPLIFHLLDTLTSLKVYIKDITVILGYKKEQIEPVIRKQYPRIRFAYQKRLNGTAKAVETARSHVKENTTLIICADTPLITRETLKQFICFYFKHNADGALITSVLNDDNDFGRILRNEAGDVARIIEKKDLGRRNLPEVNSGIYIFKSNVFLPGLKKIKINPKKKEYYFTDIIEILSHSGATVKAFCLNEWSEMLGINDQRAMALAYKILNKRYLDTLMKQGVRVINPDTTFLNYNTKVGQNVVIYPFTFIEKGVIIGNNCHIGPFVYLRENTVIGDNTYIGGKARGIFEEAMKSPLGGSSGH